MTKSQLPRQAGSQAKGWLPHKVDPLKNLLWSTHSLRMHLLSVCTLTHVKKRIYCQKIMDDQSGSEKCHMVDFDLSSLVDAKGRYV